MEESKIPWIRFQKTFGCGTVRGQRILDQFGKPEEIFREPMAKLAASGMFTPGELRIMADQGTEEIAWKVLERCERCGGRAVTPDDPDYPERLRQIYNRPAVLYVRGDLSGLDESLAIAMVGTRRPSDYGVKAAERIAGELAEKGTVIVSGLARGVDTVSHNAAVKAGGRSIAVLGCGIDIAYPPENARLIELIIRWNGAIITEFPPGEQPLRYHFPVRNRIISGLSDGVVIVEGTRRSGSLITAGHAYAQNREVFAVPGSIFSEASEGPNYLLSQHAKAVDCVESILEEYDYRLQWEPREEKKIFSSKSSSRFEESEKNGYNDERRSRPGRGRGGAEPAEEQAMPSYLNEAQQMVYQVLLSGSGPRSADDISEECGLPVPKVLSALTQMELFGLIRSNPGRRFTLL